VVCCKIRGKTRFHQLTCIIIGSDIHVHVDWAIERPTRRPKGRHHIVIVYTILADRNFAENIAVQSCKQDHRQENWGRQGGLDTLHTKIGIHMNTKIQKKCGSIQHPTSD
jgi:hypothetical protein